LLLAVVAASAVTVLFGLSTIFAFGAATHRRASLSWTSSSANADLVQVICHHGQFHLTIEYLVLPGSPPSAEPRGWHAGVRYHPGLDLNVRISEPVTSRYGAGVSWDGNGPRFYVGLFGLYPTLLLWGLVWVIARRKQHDSSHCPTCGYDLRATPQRCPECGTVPPATRTVA
jgi:hypothetical protein